MQSMKGTLLLLTLGLSASGICASSHLVGDLLNGVAKAGKDIGKIAVNVTHEGTQALEEFVDNLKNANSDLLKDAGEIGKAVRKNLHETLASFEGDVQQALEDLETRVQKESSSIKKAILNNSIDALNKLNKTVDTVQAKLAEINEEVGESINKQVEAVLKVLKDWEETQNARVGSNSEGQKIISELAERYNFILKGCKLEVEFLRVEFEYQLQAQVEKYQAISKQLVTEVSQCARKLLVDGRCQNNIEQLVEQLSNAPKDFLDLFTNAKIQESAEDAFQTCTNLVLSELQNDLKEAEAALDKLLADQNAEEKA